MLLQAEGDQQEDAPSLGLFAAKLYLYLGELKFAKLDVCAPVLGASGRLTSCTGNPPGGTLSPWKAAEGAWSGLGSESLSIGPTPGSKRGLPVWQGLFSCAPPGACMQATDAGHKC